ncbi:type II toxin-antitoxin system death-on-curing family toxin [Amaricoccus sp.]|uniref:type II toxin-antitoxin system death-on-curing family toxin n=1 Tax=Amaricoccus sp. TaxID=1872485 RepID=UPI00262663B9|nr:type II toxin-antitoxin system death-on-curing family toxin [Amaricoccus sp.]HRO10795.1 type II toxin-antitoxin system death-on-curing family toxin [Amaricoccus sp.]
MSGPVWVPIRAITVIHDRQISRHGGSPGTRDLALLEMGCARAMDLHAYGRPSLAEMAAAYAFGLAKAHAFVDGNKRTAFVTAVTFLRLNGYAFRPGPHEGVRMMEGLASGDVDEAGFAAWLAEGMTRLP